MRLMLVVLLFVNLLGTSCWANAEAAKAEKVLTMRLLSEPETLDWNRAHTPIETHLLVNLMEGLLTLDQNLKVNPALAQSWKVSRDGKLYTFKLRPGVKWSDGVPLKAQDFVYSWKRLLTPSTAAAYAYLLYNIEGAEAFNKGKNQDFSAVGVKALDDLTLEVRLIRPESQWIYIPSFWVTFPLRSDIVEKQGPSWEMPGKMVTLGAYTLSARDLESKIVMKANPNYYGKKGNVDQVVGLIINDASTALNLYEAGRLDVMGDLSTLDLKRMEKRPDLKTFPYLKTAYIGFLTDKAPVSNVKLRRAIAMSIDKVKLAELLHGGQQAASSFVPPQVLGHSQKIGFPFDPVRARAELKSSGINISQPIQIDLVIINWDRALMIAEYIQGELKKNLGIQVTLQPFDNKTYRSRLDMHVFPLFLGSWSGDYPDPDNFLSIFFSGAGNNRTGWKSQKFDELLLKARHLLKPSEREKIYFDLQKLLIEDQAVILPTFYEPNKLLVRPRVQNLELNPVNYLNLRKVNLAD